MKKSMIKNNIVYIEPIALANNEYYQNFLDSIESLNCTCHGSKLFWRKNFFTNPSKNTFIFSWMEDGLVKKTLWQTSKYFITELFKLCLLKIFKNKIVWIRHNYTPHRLNDSHRLTKYFFYSFVWCLGKLSDNKLAHSEVFCKNYGFDYIPHPLYKCENAKKSMELKEGYLIFGRLMRYKEILELLVQWPSNTKLTIKGLPEDESYKLELEKVISSRNLNVLFTPFYISAEELTHSLTRAEYVLVTNRENTMIASGVIVHALSFGCKVLSAQNEFASELEAKGLPVKVFNSVTALSELVKNNEMLTNQFDFELVEKHFDEKSITHQFKAILK